MLGTIGFDNYTIRCIIGELAEERKNEQLILVSIRVLTDFSECVQSDEINDTVDYVAIANICTEVALKGNFFLLETYANRVLDTLLDSFSIHSARIIVKKPNGLDNADHSIVELKKDKE